jgi:outer membrane lipoprotein LolB
MRQATLIATLALAGCATVAPAPAPVDWARWQQELLALDGWRLTGRVAVSAGGDGGSAAIDWRQDGETADIAVSGPLGVGSLRAVLDEAGLRLEDGSGARLAGAEAEQALAGRLGTEVPVEALRFWVLGLPAPGEAFVESRGPDGRPQALSQAGWDVRIERYGPVRGGELPVRLSMVRDGARVRLVVSRWELAP